MDFVHWDASMAVGVGRIDDQHKELIAIINELSQALGTDRQQAVVAKTVEVLMRYLREHLRDEEAIMAQNEYPLMDGHLREHHAFETTLAGFHLGGESLDLALVDKMYFFLTSWLVNHICLSDQKLGEYLKKRGQPVLDK